MKIRLRRGPAHPEGVDDRGSLPMALLVTLVGMALSAALVPVVVNQVISTRVVSARTQALDAAQAGIDAALGQLRSATTTATSSEGKLENLPPCEMTGETTGDLATSKDLTQLAGDEDIGVLRYRVTIAYFGLPDDADDATPTPLGCPALDVPTTATLTATGSGSATGALTAGTPGTRTIEATYTFKTNNENITGGAIQLASPTTNPLCMDGGLDASPATGSSVKMQLCKSGGSSDQRFAYTTDLNIKLVGSETTAAPAGMCLDAPVPHATNGLVTFQPCLGRSARQQWSLDNNSNFRGTTDGVNLDAFCLNLANPGAAGSTIVLGPCGNVADRRTFRPQTGTGAGMASAATGQLVNYKQFSRCLDVTNHAPTSSYMIVWFCKQAPDGAVSWNQKWTLPPVTTTAADAHPERIRTAGSGNPGYCLLTPTSTAGYVTMSPCALTGALTENRMKWTMYGNTGDYTTSFRIVDTNGYCLTPTSLTVAAPDTHGDGTAKVKVAPCTSSELQKWNAPANFNKPLTLTDTWEK
jgi:hypothetical protein